MVPESRRVIFSMDEMSCSMRLTETPIFLEQSPYRFSVIRFILNYLLVAVARAETKGVFS